MSIFNKSKGNNSIVKKWKIKQECLDLILECAKSNYPNEFGGLLRVEQKLKNLITELVILPGTISGDAHAIFQLHMLPIDFSIVGSVHSHPGPNPRPSKADLNLFSNFGRVHIIVASPYNQTSWRAYDYNGKELDITII